MRRRRKKTSTTSWNHLLVLFVRVFYFSLFLNKRDRKKAKSWFYSIANDALHIVWLVSFTLPSCIKMKHFKKEKSLSLLSEKEKEATRFFFCFLHQCCYGVLFFIFIKFVENHCSVNGIYLLLSCLFILWTRVTFFCLLSNGSQLHHDSIVLD